MSDDEARQEPGEVDEVLDAELRSPRMLVLVRHAEAKSASGTADKERELTKAGRKVARAVGARMTADGVRFDLAVCSPAVRTATTCDEMREGGLSVRDVWGDEAIYEADVDDVLDSIREVPEDVRTLLVVGHAPGVPGVVLEVADHTGLPQEELKRRIVEWPPAGAGVIVHEGEWSAFPDDSSALVLLQDPPGEE